MNADRNLQHKSEREVKDEGGEERGDQRAPSMIKIPQTLGRNSTDLSFASISETRRSLLNFNLLLCSMGKSTTIGASPLGRAAT